MTYEGLMAHCLILPSFFVKFIRAFAPHLNFKAQNLPTKFTRIFVCLTKTLVIITNINYVSYQVLKKNLPNSCIAIRMNLIYYELKVNVDLMY